MKMKHSKTLFAVLLALMTILQSVLAQVPTRTATAVPTLINGFIVSIMLIDGGFGYKNAPSVFISGGGGSGAKAMATILNGVVDKIIVLNAGNGYTGTPTVTVESPPIHQYTIEDIVMVPKLTIRGEIGTRYWIMSGTDINDGTTWVVVTNIILATDPFIYVDTNGESSRRFYQAMSEIFPITQESNNFVWINPGTYTMGSPETEKDRGANEGPQTKVTITKGFWMGKCEVTQKEFLTIMGSNPSLFIGDSSRPVEQVSWIEATNYCGELTQQERSAGRLPTGYVYRLPTEAEWEYACRAGTTTRFNYGDDLDYSRLKDYAWYYANSENTTYPVGQKLPNAWGLYDMHGNVWEWCFDKYASTLPGGSVIDPKGPKSGLLRVLRGGSWDSLNGRDGRYCRSANRYDYTPDWRYCYMGFRIVLAPIIE